MDRPPAFTDGEDLQIFKVNDFEWLQYNERWQKYRSKSKSTFKKAGLALFHNLPKAMKNTVRHAYNQGRCDFMSQNGNVALKALFIVIAVETFTILIFRISNLYKLT